ncbi:hypothetical protein VNO78_14479 [Psophocarpus tetragonolobus]|uniref:Secreted protein n=1 Tax=Psophocarpus tetragonolobus TaxID=3891 RepID=A0AAN9XQQ7_PSOTE
MPLAFFLLVLCPPAFVLEYFGQRYVSRIFRLYNACPCCSPFKEVNCSLTGGSCLCNCAIFLAFRFRKLVRNIGRLFYNYGCGKRNR